MIHDLENYQRINYFANENNNLEFKTYATNIKYIIDNNLKFINEKFIILHYRIKNDNMWDETLSNLNILINKFINKYKIIIFTENTIDPFNDNIHIIYNLQEYATYMNHKNCIALISVWSGGGQLGQYCNNSKVIQYFSPCQINGNENLKEKLNVWLQSPNAYDFATFSDCERLFFSSFNDMLLYIDNI